MSIICAFQFNVEVERGALRSLIGGLSNRFPGNRVSRDRPVLPLPLRRQNGSKLCFKGIPRVAAAASGGHLGKVEGTRLAEVYAVKIHNINNENPGDLYGTVNVTDQKNNHSIYDRDRGKVESIAPGQYALLTGPSIQPILATDSFTIDVDLTNKQDSSSPDKPISQENISWKAKDDTNIYDNPIPHQIDGENGSATVFYAVLNNAVQASVEVTMIHSGDDDIDNDKGKKASVYGNIKATNTKIKNNFESVLFRSNTEDCASVRPGKHIPLARSIVAVPLDSNLIVHANLHNYNLSSDDDDDEIANGTATFPAKQSDSSFKTIYGKDGEIKVKVTWKYITD